MAILALVWGILAFLGFIVGMVPCLGAFNWLNIPFAVVGAIIGAVARSKTPQGQSNTMATAGLVLSLIAIVIGVVRLMLGGGIL